MKLLVIVVLVFAASALAMVLPEYDDYVYCGFIGLAFSLGGEFK